MQRRTERPSADEARAWKGASVTKTFDAGVFKGKVTSVDAKQQPFLFKIVFEDDDSEQVEWDELLRILDHPDAPPSRGKVKREAADDGGAAGRSGEACESRNGDLGRSCPSDLSSAQAHSP